MQNRHAYRLKSWDYRAKGAYFVTICAWKRRPVFGEIRGEIMGLNRFGCVVWDEWRLLESRRPNLILDEFIVMPNHLHLILFLTNEQIPSAEPDNSLTPDSLGAVIGGFKSGVTREIGRLRGIKTEVWQGRYRDRVVRDERELLLMRQYIRNNVVNWPKDKHFASDI